MDYLQPTNLQSVDSWPFAVTFHARFDFLDPLTLFASFLFNLVAIASRRSTPKCHGFTLTVSFISARTNILLNRTRLAPGNYSMYVCMYCSTGVKLESNGKRGF